MKELSVLRMSFDFLDTVNLGAEEKEGHHNCLTFRNFIKNIIKERR